ncbi:hypothetical protein ACP4OV_021431 [Aristida adscensionis]
MTATILQLTSPLLQGPCLSLAHKVATYNKDYSHYARGVVGVEFLVIYLLFSRSEESSQGFKA